MRYILILFVALFSFSASAQDSIPQPVADSVRPNKRPIKEVKVWKDGKQYDANDIDVVCAYDNFESSATLYFKLTDSTGAIVSDGNITISGADYVEWASKPRHNVTGTNYAIKYLNLQETVRRRTIRAARVSSTVSQ